MIADSRTYLYNVQALKGSIFTIVLHVWANSISSRHLLALCCSAAGGRAVLWSGVHRHDERDAVYSELRYDGSRR